MFKKLFLIFAWFNDLGADDQAHGHDNSSFF